MKKILFSTGIIVLTIGIHSCAFSPINLQYERAKTLDKGGVELSANVSSYSIAGEKTNSNYGFRAGLGVSKNVDIKLRYEHLVTSNAFEFEETAGDDISGIEYISLVPKFSIVKDKLAFLVPLSLYSYQETIDGVKSRNKMYSITPQVLYTLPVKKDKIDVSFGVKGDCLFASEGMSILMSATAGAGFSSNLDRWAIRPEFGASFTGGESILCYGISLQLILPRKSTK